MGMDGSTEWFDQNQETKTLPVFSYLHVLAADSLLFHILFMPSTNSFSPLPVHKGPVAHPLCLDDPSHELSLVHWRTDDFQVVGVDDDLTKVNNWGSLQEDLISFPPV